MSTSAIITLAIDDKRHTGDERLAILSTCDTHGELRVRSICEWANVSEGRAHEVIASLLYQGTAVSGFHRAFDREATFIPRYADEAYFSNMGYYPWQVPPPREGARKAISATVRRRVYNRDCHLCVYCGADEDLTLDHITPLSRGGKDTEDNLCTCCKRCNSAKGARTPEEWGGPK